MAQLLSIGCTSPLSLRLSSNSTRRQTPVHMYPYTLRRLPPPLHLHHTSRRHHRHHHDVLLVVHDPPKPKPKPKPKPWVNKLKGPAIALVVFIAAIIMTHPRPLSAWAASGGRAGGWSSSSYSDDDDVTEDHKSRSSSSYSFSLFESIIFVYLLVIHTVKEDDEEYGKELIHDSLMWFIQFLMWVIQLPYSVSTIILLHIGLDNKTTTVLQLQVGLLGQAKSMQKELNHIAETCDTSTPAQLHHLLIETTLALQRHPDYCISAYSYADVKTSLDESQKRFNQLSIEERSKFDEETLVNVNGIRRKCPTILRDNGFNNEYIVVTILVGVEGDHSLLIINDSKDLKEALLKLGSISSTKIKGVEVLWTPQAENDT